MIKINIKKLEKITGYKIQKGFTTIGLDIATKTGYAILTSDQKNVILDCGFISFDKSTDHQRYKQFYMAFKELITTQDLTVIEDTFLGRNPNGMKQLTRFGTLAIATCIDKRVPYEIIGAASARAKLKIDSRKFGKGKSKLAVADYLKTKLDIDLGMELNDVSDAIVLAILGLCREMDFRSDAEIKKDAKGKI